MLYFPSHTLILLMCLIVGWGLAAAALEIARTLPRWGDRRALHQLALFSPLLTLGLAGGWSVQMVFAGCLMFSTADGIGTIVLMSTVAGLLLCAGVRESWCIMSVRRRLEAFAHPLLPGDLDAPIAILSARLRVPIPRLRLLDMSQPLACVSGVARPALFISRGTLAALSPEETEGLVAHELAHLRHQDNMIAWLDVILLKAFRFVPPLGRAWQESLAEREEAADARAAALTRRPLALASALVKVADWERPDAVGDVPASAPFDGGTALLARRVSRLLAMPVEQGRSWGLPALGALLVAVTLPFVTAGALGLATRCLGH